MVIYAACAIENVAAIAASAVRTALAAAMTERDLDPTIVTYEARVKKGSEIPELVTAAALEADVLIALNSTSYLHSSAFPKIYHPGGKLRVLLLPAGESVNRGGDAIYRLLPRNKEEMLEVAELTKKVGARLADNSASDCRMIAAFGQSRDS